MGWAIPSAALAPARPDDGQGHALSPRGVAVVYGLFGALFVGYVVSALIVHPDGRWLSSLANWPADGLELTASGLCLARAVMYPHDRRLAAFVGSGLLAWSVGDVIWTMSTGAGLPPTPP